MPPSMVAGAAGHVVQAPRRPSITTLRPGLTPNTSMSPPSAKSTGRNGFSTASMFSTVSSLGTSTVSAAVPVGVAIARSKGLEKRGPAWPSAGPTAWFPIVCAVCSLTTLLQSSPSTARKKRCRRSRSLTSSPATASSRFLPMASSIFHFCSSKARCSSALSAAPCPTGTLAKTAARSSATRPSSSAHERRTSSSLARVHILGLVPKSRTRAKRGAFADCCHLRRSPCTRRE
mmetsp:Transcript_9021/g.20203  ORF Transcript_9021/g.20203 Transcript_9021/m.20203 type:complete len:232 (-) Transcript_9021:508-1203(-)